MTHGRIIFVKIVDSVVLADCLCRASQTKDFTSPITARICFYLYTFYLLQ